MNGETIEYEEWESLGDRTAAEMKKKLREEGFRLYEDAGEGWAAVKMPDNTGYAFVVDDVVWGVGETEMACIEHAQESLDFEEEGIDPDDCEKYIVDASTDCMKDVVENSNTDFRWVWDGVYKGSTLGISTKEETRLKKARLLNGYVLKG